MESLNLLGMEPEKLLGLQIGDLGDRILSREEIEAIFSADDAFWGHPGQANIKAPHAILHSGKHSNGYINCPRVLRHANLCQVMAHQLAMILESRLDEMPDWVLGSATSALGLSQMVALYFGAKWHPLRKTPEGQLWEKMVIEPGEKILHVEELITTAKTTLEVRRAIREGNPHPVTFLPEMGVMVHRAPPGACDRVDGSIVSHVIYFDFQTWEPSNCPLCQAGSPALTAKDHWAELTG